MPGLFIITVSIISEIYFTWTINTILIPHDNY